MHRGMRLQKQAALSGRSYRHRPTRPSTIRSRSSMPAAPPAGSPDFIVDGTPPVQVDFALNGGELPGSTATAAWAVNAIPAVCAAQPGILSALALVVAGQAAPNKARRQR